MKAAYGRLIAAVKRTAAQGKRVLEAVRERADWRRRSDWPSGSARSCRG